MLNKNVRLLVFITVIYLAIIGKSVYAAEPPLRPENLVADFPQYNKVSNENKIPLSWSASAGADFYILQVSSDSNWAGQTISQQIIVNGLSYDDIRKNLTSNPSSGTVYNYRIYAATYLLDDYGDPTTEYITSSTYSSVTVLTDAAISATSLTTTDVELKWDDIQYESGSIDYQIHIYRNGVKVGQEEINAVDIGNTVSRVNGKIKYTVSGLDKSTEYTFRLVPILDSTLIKYNPYVAFSGATKISAYLQKYNEGIMKLLWGEYKGSVPSSDLYYKVLEITQQNGTKVYKVIATPEVPYYFIQIKEDKEYSYSVQVLQKSDDKKIAESSEVSLSEVVIPATPEIPDIQFIPTKNSITLEWDVQKNIDESRDSEIKHDIWILTDPNNIDNIRKFYLPSSSGVTDGRVASDLQVIGGVSSDSNFYLTKNGNEDIYRYIIRNLSINTNYYIGVVAKKTFLMQDPEDQDLIISTTYVSEPMVQNVTTTSGNIEQPIALIQPTGLEIALNETGKPMITNTSITVKWPIAKTVNDILVNYYQDDVYFKVGHEKYTDAFDKSKTNDTNNPNYNLDSSNNVVIDELEDGVYAYVTIDGLEKNTQYVFWVKAFRDVPTDPEVTKISEASDPIVSATLSDYTIPDFKPPVPTLSIIDNKYHDKISLQFNTEAGVEYKIIWGLQDKNDAMTLSKTYTATINKTPEIIVIDKLLPETTYYFKVRATYNGNTSDWSDSILGKTTSIPFPDAPKGFGLKRVALCFNC